ncbi:MAG: flippase-like domain-containing protein, partial [Elusimicrobia bacterium]|nr:flippase-like domain-containing protein [Elusimicrobiota bacterium]
MKTLERLILLAGVATILLLLWHFNPRQVWGMVSRVGIWGLLAILSFQICDHTLNALGWRMAFPREDARGVPLWLLIKGRLAGDGVNYLTPSGQIVGELVRPGMLGKTASEHAKNSSVVIAKLAQTMGQ